MLSIVIKRWCYVKKNLVDNLGIYVPLIDKAVTQKYNNFI